MGETKAMTVYSANNSLISKLNPAADYSTVADYSVWYLNYSYFSGLCKD